MEHKYLSKIFHGRDQRIIMLSASYNKQYEAIESLKKYKEIHVSNYSKLNEMLW